MWHSGFEFWHSKRFASEGQVLKILALVVIAVAVFENRPVEMLLHDVVESIFERESLRRPSNTGAFATGGSGCLSRWRAERRSFAVGAKTC